jgi:hypothetical protein
VFYKDLRERTGILEAIIGNGVVMLVRTSITSNTSKDKLLVELLKEYLTPTTKPRLLVSNPGYRFLATKNYIR